MHYLNITRGSKMKRHAKMERRTRETEVAVSLTIQGTGKGSSDTGIGFFNHLLDTLRHHGALDLDVKTAGDLNIDGHHTVEDTAIVIGQAIDKALGDRAGICRFAVSYGPLDEALVRAVVDISGRGGFYYTTVCPLFQVGEFAGELLPEFFRALAMNARLTLHLDILKGENQHHIQEAAMKAFALAWRQASTLDPEQSGVPSTKGTLK